MPWQRDLQSAFPRNCKLIFPTDSGELTKEGKEFLGKHSQSDNLDIRYDIFIILFFISDHEILSRSVERSSLSFHLFIIETFWFTEYFYIWLFFTLRNLFVFFGIWFLMNLYSFCAGNCASSLLNFVLQRLPRRELIFCAGMPHRKLNFLHRNAAQQSRKRAENCPFCAGMLHSKLTVLRRNAAQ
jgi:hypothetical protein